jgi:hypothetical protein
MARGRKQSTRRPATKFTHLRNKMVQAKGRPLGEKKT